MLQKTQWSWSLWLAKLTSVSRQAVMNTSTWPQMPGVHPLTGTLVPQNIFKHTTKSLVQTLGVLNRLLPSNSLLPSPWCSPCSRPTCLFSDSLTAWFTWLRIWRQWSAAFFTFSFSSGSSAREKGNVIMLSNKGWKSQKPSAVCWPQTWERELKFAE